MILHSENSDFENIEANTVVPCNVEIPRKVVQ